MSKGPEAFRTISEVAEALDLPQHVLRFWETRFVQIRPLKRGGGRRYYRPDDVDLLRGIRQLLYGEGFTIKGVQRILKEQGPRFVIDAGRGELDGRASLAQRSRPRGRPTVEKDHERQSGDDADTPLTDTARGYDETDVVPRVDMAERTSEISRQPKLTGEEVKVLKAALAELLECRRLLEETR